MLKQSYLFPSNWMSTNPEELLPQISKISSLEEGKMNRFDIPMDVEYLITSNFLKHISNSLAPKELHIIAKSNELLDQFQTSKALESTVDFTSSRSQLTLSSIPSTNFFKANPCERKLISRKSPKALPADLQLQRCLRDVEENCSGTTLNTIRNMIEDMKNMKKTIIQLEATEKLSSTKGNHLQRIQEENYIMKSQIQELKESVLKFQNEKKQGSEIKSHRSSKIGNSQQVLKKIDEGRSFLQQKQKYVNLKMKQALEISKSIEIVMEKKQNQERSCEQCCSFMKRIKDSLVKYRNYLGEQEGVLDALYSEYKGILVKAP